MRSSSFHFISGLFVLVFFAGVLSVVTTSSDALMATVYGATITSVNAQFVGTGTASYTTSLSWNTGRMKGMGYINLQDGTQVVRLNIAARGATQYAMVPQVANSFTDLPTTFSLKNKSVVAAAEAATKWSASPAISYAITPALAGKWIGFYVFAKNSDNVSAINFPNKIDDVALLIVHVPDQKIAPPPVSAIQVTVPAGWTGPANVAYPVPKNQVLGFVKIAATGTQAIEVNSMNFSLSTTLPYTGMLSVMQAPGTVINDLYTLDGAALGSSKFTNVSSAKKTIYQGNAEIDFAKPMQIVAGNSIIVALVADGVTNFSSPVKFAYAISGTSWHTAGSALAKMPDLTASLPQQVVNFSHVSLSAVTGASTPSGAETISQEQPVAVFVLDASKNDASMAPLSVSGVRVHIDAPTTFLAKVGGDKIRVYLGTNIQPSALLGEAATADALGKNGALILFPQATLLSMGSYLPLTVTVNTSVGGLSGGTVQAQLTGTVIGMGSGVSPYEDTTLTAKGKVLYY